MDASGRVIKRPDVCPDCEEVEYFNGLACHHSVIQNKYSLRQRCKDVMKRGECPLQIETKKSVVCPLCGANDGHCEVCGACVNCQDCVVWS